MADVVIPRRSATPTCCMSVPSRAWAAWDAACGAKAGEVKAGLVAGRTGAMTGRAVAAVAAMTSPVVAVAACTR